MIQSRARTQRRTHDQANFHHSDSKNNNNMRGSRVLGITTLEASLSDECSLLIAETRGNRNASKRTFMDIAVDFGRRFDGRQDVARYTKVLEQQIVPLTGAQIHEHGATGIGNIGDMVATVGRTTSEIPDEPRIHGARQTRAVLKGLRDGGHVLAQPSQLESAEISRNGQSAALLQCIGSTELLAHGIDNLAGARIQPNNRLETLTVKKSFWFSFKWKMSHCAKACPLLGPRQQSFRVGW